MANPLADIPKLSRAAAPAEIGGRCETGEPVGVGDADFKDTNGRFSDPANSLRSIVGSSQPAAEAALAKPVRLAAASSLPELWRLDSVTVPGRHRARLNAFTATINGSCIAIIGDSGAGKSSLLELLAGFVAPRGGTCRRLFDHQKISPTREQQSSRRLPVFWMPHDFGLWPHLTVAQQIRDVLPPNSGPETAAALMRDFDLSGLAAAYPEQLSQGEQARTAVARAIATGARVMLLDEPFSHLDPLRRYRFWKVLNQWCQRQNTACVFTSHVSDEVLRNADWLLAVRDGSCLFSGPPARLYDSPPDERAAWLLGPVNWFASLDEFSSWFEAAASDDTSENRNATLEFRPPGSASEFGLRPEQVTVIADARSSAVLESVVSSSGLTTVTVRHAESNATRDLFVHGNLVCEKSPEFNHGSSAPNGTTSTTSRGSSARTSASSTLSVGQRVRLAVLGLLLMLSVCSGCVPAGAAAALPVSEVNYIPTPVSGAKTPSPRAVSFGVDNEFFVLDNAGRVLRYNESRELTQQWFMPAYSVGRPEGICRLQDGRVAVADTHYHRVVLFDLAGKVERMWGVLGLEPGQFVYPIAILQTPDGSLYVSEYGEYAQKDRVQKFTPDGEFLLEFGSQGTGPGQFQRPSGLAWYDGLIYVADAFNNRIQMFTEQGEYRGVLGGETPPSDMNYPYDLAIDSVGMLYIVEYGAGRVSKYDRQGRLLGRFGHVGNGPMQFSTPWGLAVRNDGRVLVADTGNRRIVELIP